MQKKEKITEQEMQDALKRSGYFLETRIENLLQKRGFFIEPNCVYADIDTQKSRELDIYAMSALRCTDNNRDYIFYVPLIECVRPPQPIVFLIKHDPVSFLAGKEIKMSGLPIKLCQNKKWIPLHKYLEFEKFHHYCSSEIATQYCSFQFKKGETKEWMANHIEDHFDAIQTLCKSTLYFRNKHFRSWKPKGIESINIIMTPAI